MSHNDVIQPTQEDSSSSDVTWEMVDVPLPAGWEEKEDNLGMSHIMTHHYLLLIDESENMNHLKRSDLFCESQ